MFVGGNHPVDGYNNQHEGTTPETALPMDRDLAISNMTTTAPSTFASTANTVGLPHDSLQDAISFDLRLESAMQRLRAKSTFDLSAIKDQSTMITNAQRLGWRKQHALKLVGDVVCTGHSMGMLTYALLRSSRSIKF